MTVRLPDDLRQILRECVDTPLQLELLAGMAADPARWWDPDDVATRFGLEPSRAGQELEILCRRNLLDVRIANSVKYRYAPGHAPLAEGLRALLSVYKERPATVLVLLTEQARTRQIQDFSDAFDLRKKRNRG